MSEQRKKEVNLHDNKRKKLFENIQIDNKFLGIAGVNEAVEKPKDMIVKWDLFMLSDMMNESFGADIVDYYGSLGWDAIKIKKNLKAILKRIEKGGNEQLKYLARK